VAPPGRGRRRAPMRRLAAGGAPRAAMAHADAAVTAGAREEENGRKENRSLRANGAIRGATGNGGMLPGCGAPGVTGQAAL